MKSTAKAISSTPSENWAPLKYVNLNPFNLCSTSSSLLQQKKLKIPRYQKGNSRTVYILTLTKCYCSNLLISCNYDQIEQFQVGCATESSKSCRLLFVALDLAYCRGFPRHIHLFFLLSSFNLQWPDNSCAHTYAMSWNTNKKRTAVLHFSSALTSVQVQLTHMKWSVKWRVNTRKCGRANMSVLTIY